MAAHKKPNKPKRIIDVAYPGTKAADSSGRPIIVTNRPIIKDPMVNASRIVIQDGDNDSIDKAPDLNGNTRVIKTRQESRLEPLTAPLLPGTEEDKTETNNNDEDEPNHEPPLPDSSLVDNETKEIGLVPDNEPSAEVKSHHRHQAEDLKGNSNASEEAKSPQESKDEEIARATAEKPTSSKRHESVHKAKKRKKRHFVSIGLLIILILIIGWADIALDSGFIKTNLNIPHTHFFSSGTQTSQTTPIIIVRPSNLVPVSPSSVSLNNQMNAVKKLLTNYYELNKYYPSQLSALIAQSASIPTSTISPPSNTVFNYTVFPLGCTTATKVCFHYTLTAVNGSTGKLLYYIHI
jgi:hypothetical protein